ncbi:uncharacterized protein LOC121731209 [Aricia agestis]|uniref:uncharacterized protein LOC121731209 n=1 Tax=Aricia agestis TaxID=91739 RepID=UPI001C205BE1|nr:uncharacterized protein LOC121731209 [Aricia agestis]
MLFILVLAVSSLSVLEARASVDGSSRSQVLRYDMDTAKMPNSYRYHYDASDGSSRTEQGAYSSSGNSAPALKVNGAVRWYNDKGHLYEMIYKAGRRGYRTIIRRVRKMLTVAAAVAAISAQAQETTRTAQIVTEKSLVNAEGYKFNFETSDGVSRQEEAHLITVGDHQGIGVKGSYSYYSPDGTQYIVTFTADEKGYKPTIRIASQNQ